MGIFFCLCPYQVELRGLAPIGLQLASERMMDRAERSNEYSLHPILSHTIPSLRDHT